MKKLSVGLIGLLVILGFWIVSAYNGLVGMDVKIDEAWSQVQVQYQRRYDLIPNLVETVKGVANFEKETYEAVTKARSAWAESMNSGTRGDQIQAAGNVESALARLLVTVENYPQLRANENFSTLQAQLEGTENRIAVSRQDYNTVVTPYNEKIRKVPTNMIALLFGFDKEDFFEGKEGSEDAVPVDFSDDE